MAHCLNDRAAAGITEEQREFAKELIRTARAWTLARSVPVALQLPASTRSQASLVSARAPTVKPNGSTRVRAHSAARSTKVI